MNNAIKLETEANMECFIYLVIGEVVCHETDLERQISEGKAFAEHNKTCFDVAMAMAKFYKEQLELRMDAYARERKSLEEITKLKEELARCRAKNAAYLREKKQAEDKAELLEKEVADLKVPESRQNRHLRDELHRSRLECQQAWKAAEKERKENAELCMEVKGYISHLNKTAEAAEYFRDRYEATKRQLDGNNHQNMEDK